MSPILKVAIVGVGIGDSHAAAFERLGDRFAVTLLCDADRARADKLASRLAAQGLPRPHIVSDYRDAAVTGPDVDIVDVCLPPWLHYSATCAAIAAGKHVICEKPLAASLAEADEISRLAQGRQVAVMPVFQYRFGNGLAKAKHLIASGVAGKAFLTSIETHWSRKQDYYAIKWRGRKKTELGGILASHAIHAHDMLTYLLGEVRAVSAMTTVRVNPIETEDCAGALFEMADGSIAVSSATLGSADEISRMRLCCERVTMVSSLAPYTPDRDPWSFTARAPEDKAVIEAELARVPATEEGYVLQFAQFHASLMEGLEAPVTIADGRRSLELLSALYHAAHTGQRVMLPINESHPTYRGWLAQ